MKLISVLRDLILMLIVFLAFVVVILAVILAVSLFFAISGYLVTFETWDQFVPSTDTVLKTVFCHYLGYCSMGLAFWFMVSFSGVFFPNSPHFCKKIFIIGLSFITLLNIVVRCFFL
jgi:hypothetical protein